MMMMRRRSTRRRVSHGTRVLRMMRVMTRMMRVIMRMMRVIMRMMRDGRGLFKWRLTTVFR